MGRGRGVRHAPRRSGAKAGWQDRPRSSKSNGRLRVDGSRRFGRRRENRVRLPPIPAGDGGAGRLFHLDRLVHTRAADGCRPDRRGLLHQRYGRAAPQRAEPKVVGGRGRVRREPRPADDRPRIPAPGELRADRRLQRSMAQRGVLPSGRGHRRIRLHPENPSSELGRDGQPQRPHSPVRIRGELRAGRFSGRRRNSGVRARLPVLTLSRQPNPRASRRRRQRVPIGVRRDARRARAGSVHVGEPDGRTRQHRVRGRRRRLRRGQPGRPCPRLRDGAFPARGNGPAQLGEPRRIQSVHRGRVGSSPAFRAGTLQVAARRRLGDDSLTGSLGSAGCERRVRHPNEVRHLFAACFL